MGLRPPQAAALERLATLLDGLSLVKPVDVATALQHVAARSELMDFEHPFPSLCFDLATGVGKTRLMGAFIAWLHHARGVRNFFVLAPNLTIYNKLRADFTPATPKYVFTGVATLATRPPRLVTEDNWQQGTGLWQSPLGLDDVTVNLFNVAKISGNKNLVLRKPHEAIGEGIGYFDYLASLPDLVLIMDEAHRYRSDSGLKALEELGPVLGLELTATPQVMAGGRAKSFKNIAYSYPLARAIDDGFVKRPAVATRENFRREEYAGREEALERLKLVDGMHLHERVKTDLALYAAEHDARRVKPFVLVIAKDQAHADRLHALLSGAEFMGGAYAGKVITVHAAKTGTERDDTVQRLLNVESPDEPTEVVIHVEMLKEGWDVSNLYTIIPLRAAESRTLVEQSIGRGLRLPFGRRVNVAAVDRLTIVAHDRFQEIVDEANRPDSPVRAMERVYLDDVVRPGGTSRPVDVPSMADLLMGAATLPQALVNAGLAPPTPAFVPVTEEDRALVRHVRTVLDQESRAAQPYGASGAAGGARTERLIREVQVSYRPPQLDLPGVKEDPDALRKKVELIVRSWVARTIEVPRIVVVPSQDVQVTFDDFDLDVSAFPRRMPMEDDIKVQLLDSNEQEVISARGGDFVATTPDEHIVNVLMDMPLIPYQEPLSALLYKLAGQVVSFVAGYVDDSDAVERAVRQHAADFGALVYAQLKAHRRVNATRFEDRVVQGFEILKPDVVEMLPDEPLRNFRAPVDDRQAIRRMLFVGFERALYPVQRFQSDPERRFAILLEDDRTVEKWVKPAPGRFRIHWREEHLYEPDFVVETTTGRWLCEPKRDSEMTSEEVVAKARAAVAWCDRATRLTAEGGGKPWGYMLIPASAIDAAQTFAGIVARCRR
jgi:type III restriction enzyme